MRTLHVGSKMLSIAAVLVLSLFGTPASAQMSPEDQNSFGTTETPSKPQTPKTAPQSPPPSQPAAKPAALDARIVGLWELTVPTGAWVLEIHRDGTYQFHSEAQDGAPTHSGTFFASNGLWGLKSTMGVPGLVDGGVYSVESADVWNATGRLGTGVWHRRDPSKNLFN